MNDSPISVDLVLPATLQVGLLIPSIVDIVGASADAVPRRWRLSRMGGPSLDESISLTDNGVHNGEVLLLSDVDITAPVLGDRTVVEAVVAAGQGGLSSRHVGTAIWLWTVALSVMSLGVLTDGTAGVIAATVLAAAVGAVAVVSHRLRPDPLRCTAVSLGAVALAAAAGLLAVPGGTGPSGFLLAAATTGASSVFLVRVTRSEEVCLTATATFTTIAAVAILPAVFWTLPTSTVGAMLAVLALGVLGAAARLSIGLAGLAPTLPSLDGQPDAELVGDTRALRGHRILTGLVMGSAGCVVLAVVLVMIGCLTDGVPRLGGVALAAALGAALALRTRTDAATHRRIALIAGAMICATAAFALVIASVPAYAPWLAIATVGAGLAAVHPPTGRRANPMARRSVDVLECLSLAAVVPLACWVADVYGLVRDVSLL